MKKILFTLVTIFSVFTFGQNSSYLINPDKAIGYVDSCAAFWLNVYDNNLGGFYTNVDKFGNVITAWGTNKNMLTQTRDAYGFTRAYMLTGDTLYLQMAGNALDFMYAHAWDNNYGGWYSEIGQSGNVINPNANKSAFDQHYALLGISAYFEATNDTTDWDWLTLGYNHIENNLWDDRTNYFGYYDYGNFNWNNVTNKSFNATVDAVTTHLLSLYLLTEDQTYKDRLLQMADNILNHLVASMDQQAIGFVEKYDSNWNWQNNETLTIMGHVLKAAWCLGRIYQIEPDTNYIWGADKLIEDMLANGYDQEFGGPYKDYNRVTGQMVMWGNPDTAKAWWQMEQAVTAGLEMYYITQNPTYLQMADETLVFFMNHFVDHVYGEVYENRTRYGAQTWGENKGNGFKAGYHSIELGYYTYLYGKLFVKQDPVLLHYNFAPRNAARDIILSPLAIAPGQLRISSVLLDGSAYNNFNPTSRILHLPSGIGGHFEITYQLISTGLAGVIEPAIPQELELYRNYPNPFNPSTTIGYKLLHNNQVALTIYNVNGQKIRQLVHDVQAAGYYQLKWDGKNEQGHSVSSGLYLYELKAGERREVKRMVLLK